MCNNLFYDLSSPNEIDPAFVVRDVNDWYNRLMSEDERLKNIIVDRSMLSHIIEANGLYVDKTEMIYNLVRWGGYVFLSRPRRFGKSLTVDTLKEIFLGNRELFKGTYIYDKYCFESYPVLTFSMNIIGTQEVEVKKNILVSILREMAKAHGVEKDVDYSSFDPSYCFMSLLSCIKEKYRKPVAVLVDEYDAPLLNAINNKEKLEKTRDLLSSFYEVLKIKEDSIHFCFITGITRFAQVSIFSKLNNLNDITDDPRYATLCGYTDEEIDKYFTPYIERYFKMEGISDSEKKKEFRARIKEYYDGYCFSLKNPQTLYNPVSIGYFMDKYCDFANYWIGTGAQRLVNKIIKENPILFRDGVIFSVPEHSSRLFSIEDMLSLHDPVSIYSYLLQAGYLTMKKKEDDLILDYPNREVRETMNAEALISYGINANPLNLHNLYIRFHEERTEEAVRTFKKLYALYPYDMHLKSENNYQIAFYTVLSFLHFERLEGEYKTNAGRIDIVLTVRKGLVYIIELKLDESADAAIAQIKERKYYEKYVNEGARVHLLGINFSSKEKNITDWKDEIL